MDVGAMSKRELIARELDGVPEEELDHLLDFIRTLKFRHPGHLAPALMAESSLSRDWLTSAEEDAWVDS